ncbi:MAG: DNA primase [Candidatus Sungbacteria bacterium RIFCSPLOWO2_01_FULL_60_25]|uniref:DNA primase n=1 Tax=Candidatus Sungbacteria bacterium RIFCSPLOWO2_01_FULL_60_25 TaxID=1802281 RepID=A0A1G2LDH5_9BACT|nr:MAG: DNA primase [Candidatus Lloydbacteria bacterium RIFCSPHIGHO2_01_FULL_54_11]OHA09650.1 MAG: DNA primase [Candidatus Sungbacteria bacterium RIFCSPLOWO2_01_FULL_60_25]
MPSPLEDIKHRLDLVELIQSYLRLQKAGVNWKAPCPFHSEKTPSFVVSPARQIWHCFGCGRGGSHIDFVMEMEGLEFRDALELLAKRAGVELRREDPRLRSERSRIYQLLEDAAKIFESVLHAAPAPDIRVSPQLAYLKKRGLNNETIKNFRIGYAPDSWDFAAKKLKARGYTDAELEKAGLAVKSEQESYYDRFRNRIMFPIRDASGRVVAFGGRIFDELKNPQSPSAKAIQEGGAKYINSPQTLVYDKSRVLYGFDRAKDDIRRENAVVLVEGYMDCVMSHQAGIKNTVAVSGTALSPDQLKILKRLAGAIISSFDRDAAGELATKRSLDLAGMFDFERKAAVLPEHLKDPADAVREDPALWRKTVADAKPIIAFFLERALAKHSPKTAEGRKAIAAAVLPEIKVLASEVERAHWVQTLSRAIGIDEDALWRELKKVKAGEWEATRGQTPDEITAKQETDRRTELESLLLGTIMLHPKAAREHLPAMPGHAITTDAHLRMLEAITAALAKGVEEQSLLLDALPEESREAAKRLAFQAEVVLERMESAKDREREIRICMDELEREWARGRMRVLAGDIHAAEANGEAERLHALLAEFRSVSQKIR